MAMTTNIKPLSLEETMNLDKQWKTWIQQFSLYLVAMNLKDEKDERKIALLLHYIGPDCLEIFNNFKEKDKIQYNLVVESFEKYFIPKKNIAIERHKFFKHKQGDDSLDIFLTKLKTLANNCEFKELKESLIRDIFICNMNNNNQIIRQRLLEEDDINLTNMIEKYKMIEITQENVQYLQKDDYMEISAINKSTFRSRMSRNKDTTNNPNKSWNRRNSPESRTSCGRCGYEHGERCPAYMKECKKCHKLGHFAKQCRTAVVSEINQGKYKDEYYVIGSLGINCIIDYEWIN